MEAAKGAAQDAAQAVTDGVKNLNVAASGKKQKKEKKKGGDTAAKSDAPKELPGFIKHRVELFDKIKARQDEELKSKPREDITITMVDKANPEQQKIVSGKSFETSPNEIARNISKSLFDRVVIAEVDGELFDLDRPLEKSCTLSLLDFNDPEAKKVYWHSSAHILGEAAEGRFGCYLCYGPPTDDGFFYDMAMPAGEVIAESDYKGLENLANKAIKEKQVFQRLEMTKQELLDMFSYSKYKQHYINDRVKDGESSTVYRNGPLIDLCRGPHVPHTGRIKTFKIMKNSASYFLGDAKNDSLQRLYGVSFPEKKLLDEHLHFLEEAAKRDHRKIGREQELFFFNSMSPGCPFFLPHGMIILNTLQAFLRQEYWKRGYQEVMSPNMYDSALWMRSGHWQHYSEDMFVLDVEKQKWGLKPMNCPGHCLIFANRERSWRELPIRMADFGVLHRNEASGALSGLTRVRRFQQDDTHIFCTEDQIRQEIDGLFDFLEEVYGKFGFTFKLKLSTRPDGFLGDIETWNVAEQRLGEALDEFCSKEGRARWELNPGDGAFYGPKIDITISDALKREFQCATIQLDFQLPRRFGLEYMTSEVVKAKSEGDVAKAKPPPVDEKEPEKNVDTKPGEFVEKELALGCKRPVMIHRAICGSFERFIGILCEHFGGKWPFWLSPRQVMVIPVMPSVNNYVQEIQQMFRTRMLHVDIDVGANTMQKKIRSAQLAQYNFVFVVGAEEEKNRAVNIRNRDDQSAQQRGEIVPLDEALENMVRLRDERRLTNAM